jgi:uncharacterized membrane protein YbhN (UPF0104 family)
VVLLAAAAWAAFERRSQISDASGMLSRTRLWWVLAAVGAEILSMVAFARLQRWLLRAGGVRVRLVEMFEIIMAGNALSSSLPGGPAWSAAWAFGQLRRRGANRVLAGWVLLVAGILASFGVFVIVASGAWISGGRGPLASLRWVAAALAAVPIAAALVYVLARDNDRVRSTLRSGWAAVSARSAGARSVGKAVKSVVNGLGIVRPGVVGWSEAFGLALANWLWDAACLVACIEALQFHVPWRGVLVIYGLTQISASLPITPGGIGVVEGSLAALLVAYGATSASAFAIVLLYRIVSFWGLVPIGWGAWLGLDLAERGGLRSQPHPWAVHTHAGLVDAPAPVGPERIMPPRPCDGCPEAGSPSVGPELQVI